jgi:hypothetical protein
MGGVSFPVWGCIRVVDGLFDDEHGLTVGETRQYVLRSLVDEIPTQV